MFERTATAREGRDNQMYAASGARMVAGCIVLNPERTKVVMVLLLGLRNKWVVPKGGIELDELEDYSNTALRETWEEAGVTGVIVKLLGTVEDKRPPKDWGKNNESGVPIPRTEFHFYELEATELATEWPESHMRDRRWCTYAEARAELERSKRPELLEALERSAIKRE